MMNPEAISKQSEEFTNVLAIAKVKERFVPAAIILGTLDYVLQNSPNTNSCPQQTCDKGIPAGYIKINKFLENHLFVSNATIRTLCRSDKNREFSKRIGWDWYIEPQKIIDALLKQKRLKNRYDKQTKLMSHGR